MSILFNDGVPREQRKRSPYGPSSERRMLCEAKIVPAAIVCKTMRSKINCAERHACKHGGYATHSTRLQQKCIFATMAFGNCAQRHGLAFYYAIVAKPPQYLFLCSKNTAFCYRGTLLRRRCEARILANNKQRPFFLLILIQIFLPKKVLNLFFIRKNNASQLKFTLQN